MSVKPVETFNYLSLFKKKKTKKQIHISHRDAVLQQKGKHVPVAFNYNQRKNLNNNTLLVNRLYKKAWKHAESLQQKPWVR